MSHHCLVNERQRFPVLRKRMDEVIGNFLRDGLQPSETMIGHIIEMEVWWIWGFLICLIAPEAYCVRIIEIHGRDKTYIGVYSADFQHWYTFWLFDESIIIPLYEQVVVNSRWCLRESV